MEDATRKFTALDSKAEMKEILSSVYNSLMVKGYNPINQIVGYILSEDPVLLRFLLESHHRYHDLHTQSYLKAVQSVLPVYLVSHWTYDS